MSAGLNATVWVKDQDGVNYVAFGPDSEELPDWAAEQIGDHAFEGGSRPSPKASKSGGGKKAKKAAKASQAPPSGSEGGDEAGKYADLDYNALQAAVAERNGAREDEATHIKPASRKAADLRSALEADDEAQAGE